MSHSAHTHQIGPEKQSTCRSAVRAGNNPGVCRAIGNVPCAFWLPLSRWWPFGYRIGLPETDNPTPVSVILRPAFAAGEVRQQALIAWVEGGMVASPN